MRLDPDGLDPTLGTKLVLPDQLLVAYYGEGCLKFADPERSTQDVGDPRFATVASLSNSKNMLPGDFPQTVTGLREIVNEPSHGWWDEWVRLG